MGYIWKCWGAIKGIDRSNKRLEWIYGFVSGERSLGDLIIQEVILSVDFVANKSISLQYGLGT